MPFWRRSGPRSRRAPATGRAKGADEAELIALTVPEARRLLALTFGLSAAEVRYHLRWSRWRRRHQAGARRGHYQRRSSTAASAPLSGII